MNTPRNFVAGKTALHFDKWKSITSDARILSWIKGVSIDFCGEVKQDRVPEPIHFGQSDTAKIDKEIGKLLKKGSLNMQTQPRDSSFQTFS